MTETQDVLKTNKGFISSEKNWVKPLGKNLSDFPKNRERIIKTVDWVNSFMNFDKREMHLCVC